MIEERLKAARSPAFLRDLDAIRFGVSGQVTRTCRCASRGATGASRASLLCELLQHLTCTPQRLEILDDKCAHDVRWRAHCP